MLMELIVAFELPLLVTVIVCPVLVPFRTWFPKFKLPGEIVREELTPVPLRLEVCGLFEALSLTVRVPVRVPAVVGVKVTEIVQLPPAATWLPQVFVCA